MSEHIVHQIESFRKEKDSYLGSEPDSPIPEEERGRFKGLKYFPPSPEYRVKARLVRLEKPEVVTMTTSKGTIRSYLKYAFSVSS